MDHRHFLLCHLLLFADGRTLFAVLFDFACYMGKNMETLQRIKDIGELCGKLREGTVKGEVQQGGMLKNVYSSRGVRLNYNDEGVG